MLKDGLQTQKLHFNFPRACGFHNSPSKCLPHRVCGEVLDLEPVLHLNLFEMGVDALNGIDTALVGEEARLLPIGYLQRIIAVLDMPLEAPVDFNDTPLAGFLFIEHKTLVIQEH